MVNHERAHKQNPITIVLCHIMWGGCESSLLSEIFQTITVKFMTEDYEIVNPRARIGWQIKADFMMKIFKFSLG